MSAPDFHDMKLDLLERAKQARPLGRLASTAWVRTAMRQARELHPGVQWGDFPGRLQAALMKSAQP